MKIDIASRYRPFSHEPGASCLLPKSCWAIEAFPTLLRLYSRERISEIEKLEIPLNLHGPVTEFTLQLDLEKGCVFVWGVAQEGRFRLRLEADGGKLRLHPEKAPEGMLPKKLSWQLPGAACEAPEHLERISFGSHKSQNFEGVRRRSDLLEVLPMLYALSQWTPAIDAPRTGLFSLLETSMEAFLQAAFFSILSPRLIDEQHQGLLSKETLPKDASPCALITAAGRKIRLSLIEQQGDQIVLPSMGKVCGRMVNASLKGIGFLDFEWTRGVIRRAILKVCETADISFLLPKEIHTYRVRTSLREKGEKIDAASCWKAEKGTVYFLDRFEK